MKIIVEFPQSGERIIGKRNIYELRAHYPSKLGFKVLRVRGEGSLWISEIIITYDGRPVNVVTIMEFREGRSHTRLIIMQILSNHLNGDLNGLRELIINFLILGKEINLRILRYDVRHT